MPRGVPLSPLIGQPMAARPPALPGSSPPDLLSHHAHQRYGLDAETMPDTIAPISPAPPCVCSGLYCSRPTILLRLWHFVSPTLALMSAFSHLPPGVWLSKSSDSPWEYAPSAVALFNQGCPQPSISPPAQGLVVQGALWRHAPQNRVSDSRLGPVDGLMMGTSIMLPQRGCPWV